ncbi:MAG: fimbrillin family protein [Rikenellaceae bacterium]
MKRFFLLAGVVIAMASCAKNEVVDINTQADNSIGFSLYTSATTKAGVETTESLKVPNNSLGVYSVWTGADNFDDMILPNARVYYSSTYGWGSTTTYYWPVNGAAMDFYAYYPFDADLTTADVSNLDEKDIIPAELMPIKETAIDQIDLLAGKALNKNIDDSEVVLEMDHLLSKVDFQLAICSESLESYIEVIINKVTLTGIANTHGGLDLIAGELVGVAYDDQTVDDSAEGKYQYFVPEGQNDAVNFDISVTSVADGKVNYAVLTDNYNETDETDAYVKSVSFTDVSIFDSNGYVIPDSYDADGNYTSSATKRNTTHISYVELDASADVSAFMLLPQTLNETGNADGFTPQQLEIIYTVKQSGLAIVVSEGSSPLTAQFDLCVDDVTKWEAGKSYLYTLLFDGANLDNANPLELTVSSVSAWVTESGYQAEVDNSTTTTGGGENE